LSGEEEEGEEEEEEYWWFLDQVETSSHLVKTLLHSLTVRQKKIKKNICRVCG
jgi:hypothetical protein